MYRGYYKLEMKTIKYGIFICSEIIFAKYGTLQRINA